MFEGADRSFFRQSDLAKIIGNERWWWGHLDQNSLFRNRGSIASSVRTRREGERMTGLRRTVFRGCTLCEASCRLALELEGDRVVGARR